VVWRVRQAAVYVAGGLVVGSALASTAYWAHQPAPTTAMQWKRYAGAGPHMGLMLHPEAISPSFVSAESTDSYDIIALSLAGGPLPYLRAAERRALNQWPGLPMLSWPTTALQVNGVLSEYLKTARRNLAGRALLMRPLLTAPNASAYRGAWRQLVRRTCAAGYKADGWVWSPPYADSIASYYPGSGYVHWVAIDCTQPAAVANPAAFYAAFRRQQASVMELHDKPVVLIIPTGSTRPMADDVRRWARKYPEIKAVIFDITRPASPMPLASMRSGSVLRPAPAPVGMAQAGAKPVARQYERPF